MPQRKGKNPNLRSEGRIVLCFRGLLLSYAITAALAKAEDNTRGLLHYGLLCCIYLSVVMLSCWQVWCRGASAPCCVHVLERVPSFTAVPLLLGQRTTEANHGWRGVSSLKASRGRSRVRMPSREKEHRRRV